MQNYSVNQHLIETLISWIKTGEIAIPEIQRPFVWKASKVRDLIDSLYKGYPVGYIITWRNPNVKLKNGVTSDGKRILIDGQQRVTALMAAVLSKRVLTKNYKEKKIVISFHPMDEKFEVRSAAIQKDKTWIHDISDIVSGDKGTLAAFNEYKDKNPDADLVKLEQSIERLKNIVKRQIGIIELGSDLEIDTVTEIFIRINSKGVPLSNADFVMSKIAADEEYGGNIMRKTIDYFCHLTVAPEFYPHIRDNDKEFQQSKYFNKIKWLKDEKEDLYDPKYDDLLRVAFTFKFNRGKFSDLVSLLSGRNFKTRTFEEEIAVESYKKLDDGILQSINETHFKRFLVIIKAAGFIENSLINSQTALNVAYAIYLRMKEDRYQPSEIEHYVKRWFVMGLLTGRYSGSAESVIDEDSKRIAETSIVDYLKLIEDSRFSEGFWDLELVQTLQTSSSNNPAFKVWLAAQCKNESKAFLSKDVTVKSLIEHRGDRHHLFPRAYLKSNGFTRGKYNQVANYVLTEQTTNIKIGKKAPGLYMQELLDDFSKYGSLKNNQELEKNLQDNCVPQSFWDHTYDDYEDFLKSRRQLMSKYIKSYYYSL